MKTTKVFSALMAGVFISLNTACSNDSIVSPDLSLETVNALAVKNQPIMQESQMTLATYNVRNLFDGVQNPGKEPEKAKPEAELKALSDAIHSINADVIALEEVESKATLTKFRDQYLSDMGYEVVLREANDPRGIDVAILSRLKILNVKSHKNAKINISGQEPGTFSRDLLQVRLKANNNYIFTLFATHLKSQHGEEIADAKRRAEAMKVRQFLRDFSKQNPKDNYLLVGDFNDTRETKEMAPLIDNRVSELNLTDIIYKDLGDGPDVYTYHPKKYRSRIDYMLISPTMMPEYATKSVNIHKFPDNGEKWTFYEASDHLPVTAKFNVSIDK